MDIPDTRPGSIIYLPVYSPGARLFVGDAHACQGDGELCGNGVKIASETAIHIDLIKDWPISWPHLENEKLIMAIGSARPLEDATRIVYRELVLWMEREYGFERWNAYMFLGQCGVVRLGNVVDPKYSVGAAIKKSTFPPTSAVALISEVMKAGFVFLIVTRSLTTRTVRVLTKC
jgi:acetamidase/formamidase